MVLTFVLFQSFWHENGEKKSQLPVNIDLNLPYNRSDKKKLIDERVMSWEILFCDIFC